MPTIFRFTYKSNQQKQHNIQAEKIETPYGGELIYKLPGGSVLTVHLKDKTKIRHKKRWSQVMYMYYLLCYRFFGDLELMEKLYSEKMVVSVDQNEKKFKGYGNLLQSIDESLRNKVFII